MRGESWLAEYLHEMTAARGLGVPIPAQGCVPVIGRGAHPSRVRVPEVEPAVIAAAGAPTDGSRIAVVACRRDPQAAKPGIKGRVAPGDLSCRAHAESSHRSRISAHYLRSVEPTGHPAGGRSEIGTLADVTLTAVFGINPWAQAPSAGPRDLPVHAPALLLPRQEQILQKILAFS